MVIGRVIQEQKNYYLIDISAEKPVRAVLKGVAKSKQKRIAVGDFAEIQIFDGIADNAVIRKILPRKNELSKPVIANIDNIFFVNCLIDPLIDFSYIDKFLFCAAVKNIPVSLVFNKCDILSETQTAELQKIAEIYENAGVPVFFTSINDEKSIEKILEAAEGKVSVFAGQSGVGKSSIMQILFPDEYFAVQELSAHLLRGKNTTSHTTLLALKSSGWFADTPGFSVFEMPSIEPQFVAAYFCDFVKVLEKSPCKFSNCSHKNEPNCGIKTAVETGEIAKSRMISFLKIFDEMTAKIKNYNN